MHIANLYIFVKDVDLYFMSIPIVFAVSLKILGSPEADCWMNYHAPESGVGPLCFAFNIFHVLNLVILFDPYT